MNRFDGGIFLENIEWFDESGNEIVKRLPVEGSGEIKWGAQLTVRESQAAVMFYKGKACDAFGPGRYTLKTANLPLLTKILSIPWRGDSPLRAEIYFINLKYFPNLKWGTQSPVAFRDKQLGLIRIRAHGVYAVQVTQPVLFINKLVGTMGRFSTEDIANYLKLVIVSRFNDLLGERLDSFFDLPGKFDEMSQGLQEKLEKDFAHLGLRLTQLYITSITPPDEVQSAIDDKSKLAIITDLDKFMQLKAASAMEKAAENQGEAGSGVGLGLGMMLPQMFAAQNARRGDDAVSWGDANLIRCLDCQNMIPGEARFCPLCGHQQVLLSQCSYCGKNLSVNAKFCPACGKPVGNGDTQKICPECKAENLRDSVFCNQCGSRLT